MWKNIFRIAMLLSFCVSLHANQQNKIEEGRQMASISADKVLIAASLTKEIYKVDEEKILKIKIQNSSSSEIQLVVINAMKDFTWNITEKNSKKNIELTKYAQEMKQSEFMRRIVENIDPEGGYIYSVNLSELFIFESNCSYTIQFTGSFMSAQKKQIYKIDGLNIVIK